MKIKILPRGDQTNGWSAIIPARAPKPVLNKDLRADWIVLGAGYAGLSAARRLAQLHPNQHIMVIDAGEVGENASGRNSGFAIDLPHNVGSSLEELESSTRYMKLARNAISHLDEIVESHKIDCDWSSDGKYHVAVSERGTTDILEPFAKELERLGEPFEWIRDKSLEEKLGSTYFTAGIYTPGGRLMNPAALTHGLADTLPGNVSIFENSPVISFHNHNGIELGTEKGNVRAPKMIMAANGFSDQFGFYKNQFMHLAAYGSLTRPLTKDEQSKFGFRRSWGMTPANAFAGITMRYTNDNRILIRQGLGYCPSRRISKVTLRRIKIKHQECFNVRFPILSDVTIEHTWSGFVTLSRNAAPGFGLLSGNIWSAVCQNAVGVTKGTISGMLAADMASGQDNELINDILSLGKPVSMPPRPFLDLGVRARFAWELLSNRHEA